MTSHGENVRLVRIFVSSPGDVSRERECLDEAIQRINDTTSGVRLQAFKWERNVAPQIGPPAQKVVDDQTPEYAIYLGIMAHRFGTPTAKHGSGTEAEFRAALARWAKLGEPWILFFFNDALVNPRDLDWGQYGRVRAFRDELEGEGLCATYQGVRGTPGAFLEKVEHHLRLVLQSISAQTTGATPTPVRPRAAKPAKPPAVPTFYRAWLQEQCADIELRGLRLKHGQAVRLDHVYVPLATSAGGDEASLRRVGRREREMEEPQLLLDLLGERSLYVSGAPGSGKSVFSRWVAWLACGGSMPRHDVEAPAGYREKLDASLRDRLPLLVRLRDFWSFLPTTPGPHELSRAELESALGRWVEAKNPPNLTWSDVQAHIENGSALLILDGVDEVPLSVGAERQASHPRALLLAGLAAAAPQWVRLGNRVLLTSRPYGLGDGEARKLGIAQAPVADLSTETQALLARRWFHALGEPDATAAEMLDHVREREWLYAPCVMQSGSVRLPSEASNLGATDDKPPGASNAPIGRLIRLRRSGPFSGRGTRKALAQSVAPGPGRDKGYRLSCTGVDRSCRESLLGR